LFVILIECTLHGLSVQFVIISFPEIFLKIELGTLKLNGSALR